MPGQRQAARAGDAEPDNMVKINVYDLTDNRALHPFGLGIYHSGVVLYGVEFAFGGHEGPGTGVFAMQPGNCPGPVQLRQTIKVGRTKLSPQEVERVLLEFASRYSGRSYHLLTRNCNHFSQEFAKALTGKRAPGWLNRLANLAKTFHCLLPGSWVPPLETPAGGGVTAGSTGMAARGRGPAGAQQGPVPHPGAGDDEMVTRTDSIALALVHGQVRR
ncbi:unnamed protein product [Pedinophyceae sp. YPF-701]|nr:unnamed protein product [Pedinophyceae sp. YPF-701]